MIRQTEPDSAQEKKKIIRKEAERNAKSKKKLTPEVTEGILGLPLNRNDDGAREDRGPPGDRKNTNEKEKIQSCEPGREPPP